MSARPPTTSPLASWPFPALALVFIALTIHLGYFVDRNHFLPYIVSYGAFFGLYIWTCFFQKNIPSKHLMALGIVLRVLLLFSLPNLSDDYFRFLWDGRLTIAGYHPFLHPPSYFIEQQIPIAGITPTLFQQLNSPHYFTVYPPVCQAAFAIAAWMAPENNWLGVIMLKLFLLACELGTMYLLRNAECGMRNNTAWWAQSWLHSCAFRIPHSALHIPHSAFRTPHSAFQNPLRPQPAGDPGSCG